MPVTSCVASISSSTTSALPMASRQRCRAQYSTASASFVRLRTPAVSMATSACPSISKRTSMESRVVPAISLTMQRSSPASAFTNELLPALRRPTSAIFISAGASALPGSGSGTMAHSLSIKSRRRKFVSAETIMGSPNPSAAPSTAWLSHDCPSTLLATTRMAALLAPRRPSSRSRSSLAIVWSSDVTPDCESMTNSTRSARSAAAAICPSIAPVSVPRSSPASSKRAPSAVYTP